jgi:hypothetical protein
MPANGFYHRATNIADGFVLIAKKNLSCWRGQINNIIKYAEAAAIFISIRAGNKSLHVVIADDGKGFHVNKKKEGDWYFQYDEPGRIF